ncbi:MAG TPA: zinc-binding alcohol dehydrogenase family protein [Acidobacteriaceae bacterium]|jgi:2-desacetyl-2-hydroxyethyl bacteriochlorophyllide A dehydrogenase
MKAVIMHAPGDVRVETVPDPTPQPGEALLRVRRVGLCGTDLSSWRGRNPLVSYPRIPGHEVAATVVEPGNSSLVPGTHVTLSPYANCGQCSACRNGRPNACRDNRTLGVQRDGALAEYIVSPADKLLTGNLQLEELCLVEPLTVGAHAVARAQIAPRDTVAIFGCGGVGLGAIAASAFRGATTIAIDVDDSKLATAREAGATHLVNSTRDNLPDALATLTNGHGPDVVIEAVGSPATFRAAVELVSFTGRVVYIGYAKEPVTYETRLFVQKELTILGARNALPADFEQVIRMLEQHRFPVARAITTTVPMDQTPHILRAWNDDPARFTRIMINLD